MKQREEIMQPAPDCQKRFNSATQRFLKPMISNFFRQEFPKFFGSVVRDKIAEEIIKIVDDLNVNANCLKPGQLLWNALDKHTRGDSKRRKFKTVILTVVSENDIKFLASGGAKRIVKRNAIARMINEAYEQGGILSMRDLGLITLCYGGDVSHIRKQYEKINDVILPHPGVLHDMGSCISHKGIIVRKVYIEKKDPTIVAQETNHTQRAVDRYLTDFNRVRCAYQHSKDMDYTHLVTGISKNVVKQYIEIIKDVDRI